MGHGFAGARAVLKQLQLAGNEYSAWADLLQDVERICGSSKGPAPTKRSRCLCCAHS
jgi:hypothetical protein